MLADDFRKAVESGASASDSFGVCLFRAVFKADSENLESLRRVFPSHVRMVELYRDNCPYMDGGLGLDVPDYALLEEMSSS